MLVWTLNLEPHTCQASAILLSYPQHNPVLTKLVPNALVWYKISHKKIFKVFLTNQYSSKISIVVHTFSLFSSLKLLSSWYGTKVCRWDSNIKADYTITQKPEEYKWNSYQFPFKTFWCLLWPPRNLQCGVYTLKAFLVESNHIPGTSFLLSMGSMLASCTEYRGALLWVSEQDQNPKPYSLDPAGDR